MTGADDTEHADSADFNDLFAGVEDSTTSLDADDPVIGTDGTLDPVDMAKNALGRVLRDLTFKEVHAFTAGAVPMFLFLVVGHPLLLLATALVQTVAAAAAAGAPVPSTVARYLTGEPHYALGGGGIGWVAGAFVLALSKLLAVLGGVIL